MANIAHINTSLSQITFSFQAIINIHPAKHGILNSTPFEPTTIYLGGFR